MAGHDFEIVELEPGESDLAGLRRQAYESVLAPSFRPEELLAEGEIAGRYVVTVALRDQQVEAVSVSDPESPGAVVLLSYLAVRPGLRGSGFGGVLLDRLVARWQRRGVGLAVGEIHDPRCFDDGPDEHPTKRLRFYERHGAELLGPWVQPSLADGSPRVHGMLLISFLRTGPFAGSKVPAELLVPWAAAYYEECEGEVPTDPMGAGLLGRYGAAGGVEPIALGDFAAIAPLESSFDL